MIGEKMIYPAIFRILIALLLLVDLLFNVGQLQELYLFNGNQYALDQNMAFLQILRENILIFQLAYMVLLVFWLFGIGRNVTSAAVFIFFTLDFLLMYPALFWGDYILKITLLYFVFVNSFGYFTWQKSIQTSGLIHKLAIIAIMLNVCLIYASNAWFKWQNQEWMSGYALAYFFNFSKVLDLHDIGSLFVENKNYIKILTWSVFLFQLSFPIFIWFKRLKWIWIAIGILMHAIMAVTLQLYKFELIMVLLYGFFVSDAEWKWLLDKFNLKLNYGKR